MAAPFENRRVERERKKEIYFTEKSLPLATCLLVGAMGDGRAVPALTDRSVSWPRKNPAQVTAQIAHSDTTGMASLPPLPQASRLTPVAY
jgi:hypothetical protein